MPIERSEWIWINDQWKPWGEATVHLTTHGLHYGSSVFEGIRAYDTGETTAIFRLGAHIRRLFDSCRIMRMDPGYTPDQVGELCIEAVARNRLESCYIRPLIYRGNEEMGLNPTDCSSRLAIYAVRWGRYLGEEAIEQGVDAAVSSWRRFNSNTAVPLGKISGQYVTNQFVSIEARQHGYAEGIMLDDRGLVCEGAGENLFLIRDGVIHTPPLYNSILGGITRDSVITIAQDLKYDVRFQPIAREELYLADELFMTGTAAEVSPVRSVDQIPIGSGSRGEITHHLQEEFFGLVEGRLPDRHDWLTPVPRLAAATSAAGA
ncbi:MAG: branched-chain amino acid transaminase [Acidobacteria bacterium]|nr:branched-chain amino acid transaminase [Acidobacteriota bacterium]